MYKKSVCERLEVGVQESERGTGVEDKEKLNTISKTRKEMALVSR